MNAPEAPRDDDDSIEATLERAQERCRKISQRVSKAGPGLRRPTPGTVDEVDPERLKDIETPSKDDPESRPVRIGTVDE